MEDERRVDESPQEASPPTEPEAEPATAPPPREPEPVAAQRATLWASRGGRWGCLVAVLVLVVLPILLLIAVAIVGAVVGARPKVALVHVEGMITAGRGAGSVLGSRDAGSERLVRLLERARTDDRVKGVVLRINSPGGSAAGSQEIYNQIRRTRGAGKPVYVSMGDVAASGGYYIAAAADRIYAGPATATGSIGVIFQTLELTELLEGLGVDVNVIKSGELKDMGSPFRPLTPREREIIQGMIDDIFEQFVDAVSQGRNMPPARVREFATGRVYTGRQAKDLGLVDELGGLQETVAAIGRRTGLGPEPRVEVYDRGTWADLLFGGNVRAGQGLLERISTPRIPSLR